MESNSLSDKLQINLVKGYQQNMITDKEIVQLLNLGFDLLNLKTISEIKNEGKSDLSYNGIKKFHPKKVNIGKFNLIIDNE